MSGITYPIKEEDELNFSFVSEGPKGKIQKLVNYSPMSQVMFNLGFGDRIGDTLTFDDKVVSDNHDPRKVFSTVIQTLELFFEKHPGLFVHIRGSTPERTRIYHWIIKNNLEKYKTKYEFWGLVGLLWEEFNPNKQYERFIINKISAA